MTDEYAALVDGEVRFTDEYAALVDGAGCGDGRTNTLRYSSLRGYAVSGHPEVSKVVVHPGGGTHGGQYYKFDMVDGAEVKIIDPSTYRAKTILDKTVFYNQHGERIVLANGKWVKQ